jgi:hypothetical protein
MVNLDLKMKAANDSHMEITTNPKGGGVLLREPFEGTWDAEGLLQLAALITGAAAVLAAIPMPKPSLVPAEPRKGPQKVAATPEQIAKTVTDKRARARRDSPRRSRSRCASCCRGLCSSGWSGGRSGRRRRSSRRSWRSRWRGLAEHAPLLRSKHTFLFDRATVSATT